MNTTHQDFGRLTWGELGRSIPFFLREYFSRYLLWIFVISSVYLFVLVPPLVVGHIVDRFLSTNAPVPREYFAWVLGLGLLTAAIAILRLEAKRQLSGFGIEAGYRARIEGFENILNQSLTWHENQASGEKLQRIRAGSQALKDFMELFYQGLLPILVSTVGVAVAFTTFGWPFVGLVLAYVGVYATLLAYFSQIIQAAHVSSNLSQEKASGSAVEATSNILAVKALGAEEGIRNVVSGAEEKVRNLQLRIRDLGTKQWQCLQLFNATTLVVLFLLLGQSSLRAHISAGSVLVLFMYFMRLVDASVDFTNLYYRLIEQKTSVVRLTALFRQAEESANVVAGRLSFPKDWQTLGFDHASFVYPSQQSGFSLSDIVLEVGRGQKVGFSGRSGSGKSTAAKLILGLYHPVRGKILIGGRSLIDLENGELQRHVAYVPQNSELFGFSLRENITMTREVSAESLEKAIQSAGLAELIERLPEGLEMVLGEHGYRLSGGERQRVAIARALCKEPEILVLDEATSSLDEETEARVLSELTKNYPQVTMILIAHRISNLRLADFVYVFDSGRIVEQGSPDTLSQDTSSLYSSLHKELQNPWQEHSKPETPR